MSSCRCALIVLCLCGLLPARTNAQSTTPAPETPDAGRRLLVGGDAAVSFSSEDPGFFNYGSYEHNTLRTFRVGLGAQLRATDRLSFLAEVRSENLDDISAFALYARVRPFKGRRFDIQVGRIPPTFGRASRTPYARENPLIGQPLAYQYLVSLRPDAVPASAAELLTMRARGWLANYSIGDPTPDAGVPLASSFEWDTGVQVSGGWKAVSMAGAVTAGTLSHPLVSDDNGGKQIAGRMTVNAAPGLQFGGSYSRGEFLSRGVIRALDLNSGSSFVQQAEGLDMEFASGHWLLRAEGIGSEWRIPIAGRTTPLRALATSVETRYAFLPGMYAAARLEHLAFNRLEGAPTPISWEAPVTRLEMGGGYYVRRNIEARASWQTNQRDGGRVTTGRFVSGQLLFWF
jgi:hypothetical protein